MHKGFALQRTFFLVAFVSALFVLPMASALPDLTSQITNVLVNNSGASCTLQLSGIISNMGNSNATNSTARWAVGTYGFPGIAVKYEGIVPLRPGTSQPVYFFNVGAMAGYVGWVSLEADYYGVVNESLESNNYVLTNFTCGVVSNQSYHLECRSNTCTSVSGAGVNACSLLGSSCGVTNQTNQTHLACVNNACVSVNGAGANLCSSNAQCTNQTTNQTSHLECRNNMCSQVNGSGVNQCSPIGSVCGNTTGSHLECRNLACVSVSGAGNNTCTTNTQCSHLACVNRTCSLVSGPGRAECTSKGARCGIVKNQTNMTIEPYAKVALSPSCGFWRRLFRLC